MQLDGENLKIQIWDTAGQERFRAMTSAFYKTASAVIVACDVTSQTSIANAEVWADEARHGAPVDTPLLLVATKTDIVKEKWAEDAKQQIRIFLLK